MASAPTASNAASMVVAASPIGFVLTLATLASAKALIARYADKIQKARALDANEPHT
jgi:hypothetical protein